MRREEGTRSNNEGTNPWVKSKFYGKVWGRGREGANPRDWQGQGQGVHIRIFQEDKWGLRNNEDANLEARFQDKVRGKSEEQQRRYELGRKRIGR
jgi:hypothetical protein